MEPELPPLPDVPVQNGEGRVQARVALALLEAVRDHDRPGEVLDDEDLTLTLPRRFGLSDVVDSQIRRYQQDVRRRRRLPESEVRDLIRLVTRRPDSEDLFHQAGRSLSSPSPEPGWRRALPRRAAYALARRYVVRRLRTLFGQPLASSAGAPFRIEAPAGLLLEGDPGGEACALVTGLAQAVLERSVPGAGVVHHSLCRALGHDRCAWEVRQPPAAEPVVPIPVGREEVHGE